MFKHVIIAALLAVAFAAPNPAPKADPKADPKAKPNIIISEPIVPPVISPVLTPINYNNWLHPVIVPSWNTIAPWNLWNPNIYHWQMTAIVCNILLGTFPEVYHHSSR
ncbi:hypothetical protein Trydic_g16891 [Trypoxylus dichotomus]